MKKTALWHRFHAEKLRESAHEYDQLARKTVDFTLKTAYKNLALAHRTNAMHHEKVAELLKRQEAKKV